MQSWLLGLAWLVLAAPALAADPTYTGTFSSVALSGYDAVAYFDDGAPQKGSKAHALQWRGATWRFASAERLERFRADPEAFAPQYGGYCAWAVANGYTASADPRAWKIVEGRLYLNYSAKIQRKWEQDIPGLIAAADRNWPRLLAE